VIVMTPTGKPPVRWRVVVTHYFCPACGAAPGQRCLTTAGVPKYEPHADRSRMASEGHWLDPDEEDPLP
jgi:hypothetical protein